jgi:hypothetical protein
MRPIFLTILLATLTGVCCRQITPQDRVKKDTLVDNKLKMKFVLDTARINISAYDFSAKLIWTTNPRVENKLREYRVKNPIIVYFSFQHADGTKDKDVIWISYSNSQFGTIDRRTGKFDFMGQD